MPKLCKYENCRLRATGDYCGFHKNVGANASASTSASASAKCKHGQSTHLYKGYCRNCYLKKYSDDPMSFQMKYKDKTLATYEYIDTRFDGFAEFEGSKGPSNRGIKINDTWLIISCNTCDAQDTHKMPQKYISVQFNTDKYKCSKTGKTVNPMLYKRLPLLEDAINRQIEKILHTSIEADHDCDFIKIDCHL